MLLGAVTCGLYLHYALWGELLLIQDADNHWIDQAHLASQLRWFYGFSFTSLLLIVGTYLVRQLKGDLVLFEYIASLYFG